MTIDFKPFCDDETGIYSFQKPFVFSGFEYATDGRIIIRRPTAEPDTKDVKVPPSLDGFFQSTISALQPYPDPIYEGVCEGCNGEGKDRCELCGHIEDCLECCGTGKSHARIGNTKLSIHYDYLIRGLPDVLFAETEKPLPAIVFRSGEVEGIVAALADDQEPAE